MFNLLESSKYKFELSKNNLLWSLRPLDEIPGGHEQVFDLPFLKFLNKGENQLICKRNISLWKKLLQSHFNPPLSRLSEVTK